MSNSWPVSVSVQSSSREVSHKVKAGNNSAVFQPQIATTNAALLACMKERPKTGLFDGLKFCYIQMHQHGTRSNWIIITSWAWKMVKSRFGVLLCTNIEDCFSVFAIFKWGKQHIPTKEWKQRNLTWTIYNVFLDFSSHRKIKSSQVKAINQSIPETFRS